MGVLLGTGEILRPLQLLQRSAVLISPNTCVLCISVIATAKVDDLSWLLEEPLNVGYYTLLI